MKLQDIVITNINKVHTVYSPKGRFEKINNRESYGLSLCLDGQITYTHNEKKYVSTKGFAIILPKGQNYYIYGDKTGYFPVINFDCQDFLCDTITLIPIQNEDLLINDYERIKKIFGYNDSKMKVFSIFYNMLHRINSNNIPQELVIAINYIRNNFSSINLTNISIAKELNISEVYFRKLFVKYFKISPKQYILEYRIEQAKKLLSEGILKISVISTMCGFSNQYHFSRIFKQHTNLTPTEYRINNIIIKI